MASNSMPSDLAYVEYKLQFLTELLRKHRCGSDQVQHFLLPGATRADVAMHTLAHALQEVGDNRDGAAKEHIAQAAITDYFRGCLARSEDLEADLRDAYDALDRVMARVRDAGTGLYSAAN